MNQDGNVFYENVFTRGCHLSLSWARWIQSTPSQLLHL